METMVMRIRVVGREKILQMKAEVGWKKPGKGEVVQPAAVVKLFQAGQTFHPCRCRRRRLTNLPPRSDDSGQFVTLSDSKARLLKIHMQKKRNPIPG